MCQELCGLNPKSTDGCDLRDLNYKSYNSFNPETLANTICGQFKNYPKALAVSFSQDLKMFEYVFQYLPLHILADVLSNPAVPFDNALDIVLNQISHDSTLFRKIDPAFYTIWYFNKVCDSRSGLTDLSFDTSIIPSNAPSNLLNYALKCKEYLIDEDYKKLTNIINHRVLI